MSKEDLSRTPGLAGLLMRLYGQRRRSATVAAAGIVVGLGFHVVFGQNGLTAYEQKRQDSLALEQQVQSLADENERLRGHVDRLENDPGAIEHEARQELHYTRSGEVIVALPSDPVAGRNSGDPKR